MDMSLSGCKLHFIFCYSPQSEIEVIKEKSEKLMNDIKFNSLWSKSSYVVTLTLIKGLTGSLASSKLR